MPGQKLPTEGQLTETFGVSRTVDPRSAGQACGRRPGRAAAGRRRVRASSISTAFGAITSEMGNKDLHRAQRARGAPGDRDRNRPGSPRSAATPRRRRRSRRPSSNSSGCCSTASRPAGRSRLPPRHRQRHQQSVLCRDARRARPPRHPLRRHLAMVDRNRAVRRIPARAAARASGHPQRHFGRRCGSRPRRHARALSASQQRYRERLQARQAYYCARGAPRKTLTGG